MKNPSALTSKCLALGFGALAAFAAIEVATPSDILAQGAGEARRERRRDALQDTFTGWDQLGATSVTGESGDASIQVASGAAASDRVRVRVESASLTIEHLLVTYVTGEHYEAAASLAFSSSQRTHEIDLPGAPRAIQRIDFHVSNVPSGQSTQVELWSR